MCGSDAPLFQAEIEDVSMQVCKSCASFGTIKGPVRSAPPKRVIAPRAPKRSAPPPVPEWVVVKDYASRIRKKRESLGLKQKELAKKLAEKESLLHKIEIGNFIPGLDLAKKIEKILRVTLIEREEPVETKVSSTKGGALTLGDIIKVQD